MAASHGLSHRQFPELLFQGELNLRQQRSLERRKKLAQFHGFLCLDEFGMKSFPSKGAEALLEIVARRHRNRSTSMTSNRPIEESGVLFGDVPAATAILDRLLEGAEVVRMSGRSDRLRNAQQVAATRKKNGGANIQSE